MNPGIECQATRRGRSWIAHLPEHGLYGHGRTLKAVRDNLAEGLAFLGVSEPVNFVATTPELELLRAAERAWQEALSQAVAALAVRRASVRDIADATGAPTRRIKALMAQLSATTAVSDPADTAADDAGDEARSATAIVEQD